MREISLYDEPTTLPIDTFVVYGETGTGKTTWSAGFPRPLFLADGSEEGWKSLKGLTDDQLFEPDVNPIVWALYEMNDLATCIEKAKPLIEAGRVKTVVLSSITFYADLYLAHLIRVHGATDMRKVYGDLGIHLREIRTRIHGLGVNVVWEALTQAPEDGKSGGPMIPGKQGDKFAAGVTYLFRAMVDEVRKEGQVTKRVFKLITQPSGGYLARTRLGQAEEQLPNPLLGGYKGFLTARGYDVETLRRSLPPIARPASTPKPAATTAPKPSISTSTNTTTPKVATPSSGAQKATTK